MKNLNKTDKTSKIAKHITEVMMQNNNEKNGDFENWIEKNQFSEEVLNRLSDPKTLLDNNNLFLVDDKEKVRNSQLLIAKIEKYNRKRLFVRISSIAAALIVASFVIWETALMDSNPDSKNNISTSIFYNKKVKISEIEMPKIITENGTEFNLGNQEKGVISNNTFIHENGNNIISSLGENDKVQDSVSYSNLIVPKQSSYTIKLSDGTVVRMNASSKLRFPNKFTDDKREVFLEGEAFFEVSKSNKTPFIVNCRNAKIEVFGTQFNVNAYSNNIVKTFLLKGSVGVRYNKNIAMMHPNQLSVINEATNSNTISDVQADNQENIVGWLNDIFIFNNVEVREVVKILAAWYGQELVVDNNLNETITARYKRSTPLEEIIKSLETITSKKILN